ncbi:alanine racemase [Geofilum rubicundum]|uniref:Diaminopimelate decarboxylase n=1 Tax=Geofilum rubicundum JCM 15548 TaxID=1236989 RepID=A0A0E9LUL0_9BACT|nr:alanine racemase [Geofilum rubicundum]GAO28973.1 diaminopimelate decarboxylase [Geofilum rubicundum JCM 15548]
MEKLKYERPVINRIQSGLPDKFGAKFVLEAKTEIEGHLVKDLLAEYGSPVYVLSEIVIRDTYRELLQAFSTRYQKVQMAWSYKTNYLDAVCRIFHQEGSWAEVVSWFEYEKALSNDVDPRNIIFNGPYKTAEELKSAIQKGSLIHVDHFDELYQIIQLSKELPEKARLAIRINMNTGIYPQWERFGFNYENGEAWNAVNRIMNTENVELVGLHTHIGTYIMSVSAYSVAAAKLADLAVRTERKYSHKIRYIDMGGGFATRNTLKGAYLPGTDTCPTFDDYAEAITGALLNSEIKPEDMPLLILETGRALIDDAGYLLGSVVANKRMASGQRGMIINIGVNHLFTSFWYEHTIIPGVPVNDDSEDTQICGPLCMNIDIIRQAVRFPLLQPGDPVVIERIGAYNMTQWLQFITYRPKIVLLGSDGEVYVIRENESLETFKAQESVPDYLKCV